MPFGTAAIETGIKPSFGGELVAGTPSFAS